MFALLGLACESAPAPREIPAETPPTRVVPMPLDQLWAPRAFDDLEALAKRATEADEGSEASLRAYVVEQLAPTGLSVETVATRETAGDEPNAAGTRIWSHVVATAPGASPDLFVLVAPLGAVVASSSSDIVREGVSGAALLLELARVLSTRSLPYTTRFVWLAGGDSAGGQALAAYMGAQGELSRLRLLVAFDRVCRGHIARDLGSHRVHREEFFDAASRSGRDRVFPRNQDYESVEASHLAFRSAGVRSVVALVGARPSAGPHQGEPCAAESLEAVGAVTLDALDAIGRRLTKIDRFSRAPLATPVGEAVASPAVSPPVPPMSDTTPNAQPVEATP